MEKRARGLVVASIAGILAAVGSAALSLGVEAAEEQGGEKAACYGVNKCKGTGACGGKGHSCHGMNACKAQGYLEIEKDTCLKIEGGRLTPEAS